MSDPFDRAPEWCRGCYGLNDYSRACRYNQPWPTAAGQCTKFDPTEECRPITATEDEPFVSIPLPVRVAARYRAAEQRFRDELREITAEIAKGPSEPGGFV